MYEISELTCMVHGPVQYSEHCNYLNDFGTRYAMKNPSKESRRDPTASNKYLKN